MMFWGFSCQFTGTAPLESICSKMQPKFTLATSTQKCSRKTTQSILHINSSFFSLTLGHQNDFTVLCESKENVHQGLRANVQRRASRVKLDYD